MPTPTPALPDLISKTSDVVSGGVSWMTSFATSIGAHTILVLGVVAVPLVGLGIGLLSRLLKKRV